MGEYANLKRKNVFRLLNWLQKKDHGIEIDNGGKHNYVVKYPYWERPFPIPTHREINRYIIQDLAKKIIESGICTKEEFDSQIK